jgi:hypothetical protein
VASNGSKFAKSGGTIYGYNTGDTNSNTVKNLPGGIWNNRGHAVVVTEDVTPTYHKETTVGPDVKLYYNDPTNGTSGW